MRFPFSNVVSSMFRAGIKGVVYGLLGAFAVFLASVGNVGGPTDPIGHALWVSLIVPAVVGLAKAIERLRTYDVKKDPHA